MHFEINLHSLIILFTVKTKMQLERTADKIEGTNKPHVYRQTRELFCIVIDELANVTFGD